jgi:hypothetical protein
LDQY